MHGSGGIVFCILYFVFFGSATPTPVRLRRGEWWQRGLVLDGGGGAGRGGERRCRRRGSKRRGSSGNTCVTCSVLRFERCPRHSHSFSFAYCVLMFFAFLASLPRCLSLRTFLWWLLVNGLQRSDPLRSSPLLALQSLCSADIFLYSPVLRCAALHCAGLRCFLFYSISISISVSFPISFFSRSLFPR